MKRSGRGSPNVGAAVHHRPELALGFRPRSGPPNLFEGGALSRIRLIGNADLREAVAQGIARKAEEAGGLALVAVGAAEGLANHFVFPLLEGHAFGEQRVSIAGSFRAGAIKMNIAKLELAAVR